MRKIINCKKNYFYNLYLKISCFNKIFSIFLILEKICKQNLNPFFQLCVQWEKFLLTFHGLFLKFASPLAELLGCQLSFIVFLFIYQ